MDKKERGRDLKILLIVLVIAVYFIFGTSAYFLRAADFVSPLPPRADELQRGDSVNESYSEYIESLRAAEEFLNTHMVRDDGHIYSYYDVRGGNVSDATMTSEAASYYLLWNALERNKVDFDRELEYIENNMIHPQGEFMMWKLGEDGKPVDDGANVATDADLRTIRALDIAYEMWGDEKYKERADILTDALENVAITPDKKFAPYGGVRNGELWTTEEVWLSYADFNSFSRIYWDRGQPWRDVYHRMKESFLEAQDEGGPYSTQLEADGATSSRLDNDKYSINSLWIMVRAAESNDPELQNSARRALEFYKASYKKDGIIFTDYNKDGTPASGGDSPWAYALVGRAAIALGDEEFADSMVNELLKEQDRNPNSETYGAFLEGPDNGKRVGQFTMQESIITLQDYIAMKTNI